MKIRSRAYLLSVLLMFLAISSPAGAQSVFSVNFLGEHRLPANSRSRALAFSYFAAKDSVYALNANEAATAYLSGVTLSLLECYSSSSVGSGDTDARINRFELPALMVGVPLRKGLVASFGYKERFEGKADFAYPRTIEGGYKGLEVYEHRSSLFAAPVTLAWSIVPRASIAATYSLERGSIRDISRVSFDIANFSDIESRRYRRFSGDSWSAAFLLELFPRLSVAAHWQSEISYNVEENFDYTTSILDSTSAWNFDLPTSWGAGATFGATSRWWLSFYYWTRKAPEPVGFEHLEGAIGDERLFAFGIERRRSQRGGFFERIPLRGGFYEDRWHLEFPSGAPVRSRFFTVGSGFAMPGGPGVVDFSLEFGRIGSLEENGIDESVFRFTISLSASESWSKRKGER